MTLPRYPQVGHYSKFKSPFFLALELGLDRIINFMHSIHLANGGLPSTAHPIPLPHPCEVPSSDSSHDERPSTGWACGIPDFGVWTWTGLRTAQGEGGEETEKNQLQLVTNCMGWYR